MSHEANRNDWRPARRLPHYAAALTLACAIPLLFVGGSVTSYDVGMAVPDAPTTMGQGALFYNWLEDSLGVQIEHGHRLLGYLVGVTSLGMVLGLFFFEPRAWVRRLGYAALAAVVAQGMLGRYRVELNALFGRELAAFHGFFAQVCVALFVALVVVTARKWLDRSAIRHEEAGRLRLTSCFLLGLLFLQFAFGAALRHFGQGFIVHASLAGVLTLLVFRLTLIVCLDASLRGVLARPAIALATTTLLQVFLGLGAMLATGLRPPGFGPAPSHAAALVTTLHLVFGTVMLTAGVTLTLGSFRFLASDRRTESETTAGSTVAPFAEAAR